MAADWSQLPEELLHLISERLDSQLYLLRFRSVCSSWRSSSSPFISIHHFPFNFPPLSDPNAPTFSLTKRTLFLITAQHQQTQTPWLIKVDQDTRSGRTRFRHPVLRSQGLSWFSCIYDLYNHPVFHFGNEFILYHSQNGPRYLLKAAAVAATTGMGNQGPMLLTTYNSQNLALFRCGEGSWSVIPDTPRSYHDVCACNGRLYAVDSTGRTVSVRPDSALDVVAEPVLSGGKKKYLVESEGMLLLVEKHMSYTEVVNDEDEEEVLEGVIFVQVDERVVRFDVFRLDEKEKMWVEMTSLGDRVLFLGDYSSFSASASDLRVGRGNCVVFQDSVFPSGLGIFHLDAAQISPLCYQSVYDRLFRPPPWSGTS